MPVVFLLLSYSTVGRVLANVFFRLPLVECVEVGEAGRLLRTFAYDACCVCLHR